MPKLVIVESPTKAKTISKFLGAKYKVESSFGHIRDLPKNKMGVDIETGTFQPHYVIPRDKRQKVKQLQNLAKQADEIIFATDEDREGEAISWHLAYIFKIKPEQATRIVFHEITKHAIEKALENPRHIDQKLVDAQQARRILDRLVGYELSPLLWKKIARGLSAGRVQSVAVRLIVEREREIQNFVSQEYWTIEADLKDKNEILTAKLIKIKGQKLKKFSLKSKTAVDEIIKQIPVNSEFEVIDKTEKNINKKPLSPFTTSSLQQSAYNKLGFSAKQTMLIAQQLYEGISINKKTTGLITYMRTDSINLADKFIKSCQDFIKNNYGSEYLGLNKFKNKTKNAQEAHEAIRPTNIELKPEDIKTYLSPQQYKLYDLIWRRAVASQMKPAEFKKTTYLLQFKEFTFEISGKINIFKGWLTLYPKQLKSETIPALKLKQRIKLLQLKPEQHFTEPPARYSDASLVKTLEEYGIGRPSTYAPTIDTIIKRNYIQRTEKKRLKPMEIAFVVNDLLMKNFPEIVDYNFTAEMEKKLDDIAAGKLAWQPVVVDFYQPFHEKILLAQKNLTQDKTINMKKLGIDPETGKPVFARLGRFGAFIQLGETDSAEKPRFAKLKKDQNLETINLEQALELLSLPKILGKNKDNQEIIVNIGRFGPYLKVANKFYSLKTIDPYEINLEQALNIIKEQETAKAKTIIKEFPEQKIQIKNGRFGPYISDGEINVKIPKNLKPEELNLKQCQELLDKKRQQKNK